MKVNCLASSSEANCTHFATDTTSILIDGGLSAKQVFAKSGVEEFDAIFITHEHSDHVKGLGALGRKTGLDIYINQLVYNKIADKLDKCNIVIMNPGDTVTVGDLTVTNFSTRHDSIYSYGYTVSDGKKKLGYLTDTGSWTKLMGNHLKGCDAYIIEADYDHDTLMAYEKYDEYLKERISSNWGHLSNDQTMSLIKYLDIKDPEFIMFAHLSPRTNSPMMVKEAALKAFPDWDEEVFLIAPTQDSIEL
ncbi:MAG: MBL fold metallo-hydrolase [Candidatus Brocadiales bacterium]|nr:MBL fold metallo-hydrolase [Candidatus Brocadiales bacterium]